MISMLKIHLTPPTLTISHIWILPMMKQSLYQRKFSLNKQVQVPSCLIGLISCLRCWQVCIHFFIIVYINYFYCNF